MSFDTHSVNQLPILTIDPEFKALIPPLLPEERSGLESMIVAEGCRDALVTWQGVLIDGHNRYEICQNHGIPFRVEEKDFDSRDDVIEWIYQNQLSRRNLTDEKRTYLIGKAYSHRKNRYGGDRKSEEVKSSPQNEDLITPQKTAEKIAQEHNVSRATVERAETYAKAVDSIAENLGEEVKQKILAGEIRANKQDIVKLSKVEPAKQAEIVERVSIGEEKDVKSAIIESNREERIEALGSPELPTGEYSVIMADPPWRYQFSETPSREIENQYPTMDLSEIRSLTVPAADDSILFMWTTAPKLEEAFSVLNSWGFTYKTCAIWDKERKGMGYYFRINHEILLVATKGKFPAPSPENRPDSIIRSPRGEHSKKPEEFYEIIEAMYPEASKLEMFCRSPREGWNAWGNEV